MPMGIVWKLSSIVECLKNLNRYTQTKDKGMRRLPNLSSTKYMYTYLWFPQANNAPSRLKISQYHNYKTPCTWTKQEREHKIWLTEPNSKREAIGCSGRAIISYPACVIRPQLILWNLVFWDDTKHKKIFSASTTIWVTKSWRKNVIMKIKKLILNFQ